MNLIKVWSKPQSRLETLTRIILVTSIVIISLGISWIFISLREDKSIVADTTFGQTTKRPWGIALDGTGHVWVAEPDCNVVPLCSSSLSNGIIAEYDSIAGNLSKIAEFAPIILPSHPTSSLTKPNFLPFNPTFLAFDKAGNVWFTDPTHGAIGKLVPATNTWTEYSVATHFHHATPSDLVIDKNGTLWFTDYTNGAIGRFDTEKNTLINETHTPSAGATLYGITQAPDGSIWYAIANKKAIGSFKPPLKGAPTLQEHTVPTNQQPMITSDDEGTLWFSTGVNGQIGQYVPLTGKTRIFCVSGTAAASHISGITVDINDNVWFDDSLNARIGVLDASQYNNNCVTGSTNGISYSQLAVNGHPDYGLTVDTAGDVFFTDVLSKQVGEITIAPSKPQPTSPYPAGPVAKTWYFPEGHYGDGFRELLTINNPDPINQCTITLQYILDKGQTTSKQITIQPSTVLEESVNNDFHTSEKVHGKVVSAIVSNNSDSDCPGIVAERSLYFTKEGISSGSNTPGATHPLTSFYFADIASGNGARSFFSILNPPGGQSADVTVNYYAHGALVDTQSVKANGGTYALLLPTNLHLPLHSAAIVKANVPVIVERNTYFHTLDINAIGPVSGASALIGAPAVAHQWYFAAGARGANSSEGKAQENLVISNLDLTANAPAHVTITLHYLNGSRRSFALTIPPRSQTIWDINAEETNSAVPEIATQVTSSGAGIVVQRQTFFQYTHASATGDTLQATGITDVLGQVDTFHSYSFAAGNNNRDYNEWLTLYNPMGKTEVIYVTMISGMGGVYSRSFTVKPSTHLVLDISTYTQANLGIPGNSNSYKVFLTVQTLDGQSFIAERSQYFNTSNTDFATQGGTIAFGYVGQ